MKKVLANGGHHLFDVLSIDRSAHDDETTTTEHILLQLRLQAKFIYYISVGQEQEQHQ